MKLVKKAARKALAVSTSPKALTPTKRARRVLRLNQKKIKPKAVGIRNADRLWLYLLLIEPQHPSCPLRGGQRLRTCRNGQGFPRRLFYQLHEDQIGRASCREGGE